MSTTNLLKEYIQLIITEDSDLQTNFSIEEFKNFNNVNDRLKYVENFGEVLGEGNSRIVYLLPNNNVLKIATNIDGIKQNKFEFIASEDESSAYFNAKVFDHADDYSWIISEFITRLGSNREFEDISGLSSGEYSLEKFIKTIMNKYDLKYVEANYPNDYELIAFAHDLRNFAINNNVSDLDYYLSWGKTKDNRLVIMDFGHNFEESEY